MNARNDFIAIEVTDVNDAPPIITQPDPVVIDEEEPIVSLKCCS